MEALYTFIKLEKWLISISEKQDIVNRVVEQWLVLMDVLHRISQLLIWTTVVLSPCSCRL